MTYREQAQNGKKWCMDCTHYRDYHRWGEMSCDVVGWIGVGQTKYRPDKTADTCKHYHHDENHPFWFEEYEEKAV